MTLKTLVLTAFLSATPLALLACGDKDDDTGASAGAGAGDCSDPAVNAFAGTCVETFLADCFDPAGECDGTVDIGTGETVLTWANGASVQTEVDTSNPTNPGVTTTIYSSTGEECAVGSSSVGGGGCASTTEYVRSSDGATQSWCISADGSMSVTCSDGSTVDVSAAEANAANECGFAGGGEPCEITY